MSIKNLKNVEKLFLDLYKLDRRSMLKNGAALLGAGLFSSFNSKSNIVKEKSVNPLSESKNPGLAKEYNIKNFGAVENSLSTGAIQKAVDTCFEAGGGTVVVPAGKFITGTIVLKSRINLFLEQGAELQSSENREDYINTFRRHEMIFCEDATEVSLTGEGVINGLGSQYYHQDQNHVYEEFDKSLTRQKESYMPEESFLQMDLLKESPGRLGLLLNSIIATK